MVLAHELTHGFDNVGESLLFIYLFFLSATSGN